MFASLKNKVLEYFELIKFEHTIFALPFALSGMLLAKSSGFPSLMTFLWVILAMVGGRTAAMSLNRLIDADIDKKNPRTAARAIPAGRIKKISAFILVLASFAVMTFAVVHLPTICIKLLPLAVFILIIYSYTKRFTYFSHFVLGGALGAGAAGGWLAVSGEITLPVVLWGMSVVFWVAGFDVVYAIQDIDFDRRNGLYSIPAWLGVDKSLKLAKIFHFLTVACLGSLCFLIPVGYFYKIALIFVLGMLKYEHSIISEHHLDKLNVAFFDINGYVSIGMFVFIILDKFFR